MQQLIEGAVVGFIVTGFAVRFNEPMLGSMYALVAVIACLGLAGSNHVR